MFKRRKPDEIELPPAVPAAAATPRPMPATGAAPVSPLTSKEDQTMGRSPFPAPPSPPSSAAPPGAVPPGASGAAVARPPMPGTPPGLGAGPGTGPLGSAPKKDAVERRTLVVGRGISVQGVVQDAERLVVEGTVEASMIHASELSVAPGGMFRGEVEVEDAELAGTVDGTLTVRGNLIIRATGRLIGTARCRRLQVEDGGQVTGRLEMITDAAARPGPAAVGEPISSNRPAPAPAQAVEPVPAQAS